MENAKEKEKTKTKQEKQLGPKQLGGKSNQAAMKTKVKSNICTFFIKSNTNIEC